MPFVRVIASHLTMLANDQVNYKLQCPTGYIPAGYSTTPKYQYDWNTEIIRDLIDKNKITINRTSLSSAAPLEGGGYSVSLLNEEHHPHDVEVMATCLATAAATDNTLTLVKSTVTTAKQSIGTATSFCPSDFPVALGGFSNADGRVLLQDMGSAPVWGTSSNPIPLGEVEDGQMGPPIGWQMRVFNANYVSAAEIIGFGICGNAPSLQTYIYSVPVPQQGPFGYRPPFSIFAPVPDGWTAVVSGFDGGPHGHYSALNLWLQDGVVVDMLQWYPDSKNYDSGTAEVRAFMVRGRGSAPSGTSARAVVAVARQVTMTSRSCW